MVKMPIMERKNPYLSKKGGVLQKHSGDITIMERTAIFMKNWLVK